jgi:hypothetical protein
MYRKPKITINACDWPSNNGCCGTETITKLYIGNHIDRFGSNTGFFFGVAGEPYIYRSLPWFGNYTPKNPKNNNKIRAKYYKFYSEGDIDINPDYDYHLYKVIKSFNMHSCSISPAFGYPGGGIQYRSDVSVKYLIDNGFITEVPWIHTPFFDDRDANIINGGRLCKFRRYKRNTKKRNYNKQKNTRKRL